MQIYLVGGAVRDELLGLTVKERDWVVVGATVQEMLSLGYRPVGKDFPVFLHPQSHEEYALARTERKTAPGYKGFIFHAAPDVTLLEDLQRRDLTINAMAKSMTGEIIDPYGGRADLRLKLLRHVSSAFVEDPVRILRVARFAARLADFSVHESTQSLMQEMVGNGEINALVAERVWQEWVKALAEAAAERFFTVLADCGALAVLFPELQNNSKGIKALNQAIHLTSSTVIRFAVLVYALDKKQIDALSQRFNIPREYRDLALIVWGQHANYVRAQSLTAESILEMLHAVDAFRRPERFAQFLTCCESIYNEDIASNNTLRLEQALAIAQSVSATDFIDLGLTGVDIGKAIKAEQINLLSKSWI